MTTAVIGGYLECLLHPSSSVVVIRYNHGRLILTLYFRFEELSFVIIVSLFFWSSSLSAAVISRPFSATTSINKRNPMNDGT